MLEDLAGYHTLRDVSARLHVPAATIARYIRSHKVPVKRAGFIVLVRLADLDGLKVPFGVVRRG